MKWINKIENNSSLVLSQLFIFDKDNIDESA